MNEADLKESVQNAIKKQCIDSKYKDESITFGQAVVTHHYFQHLASKQQQGRISPVQMIESIEHVNETNDSVPNQVVQFDLANSVSESQMQSTFYGRRKVDNKWPNNLCPNVKEALKWDEGDDQDALRGRKKTYTQRAQILMERSP